VVGSSIAKNTESIQDTILLKAFAWERKSGAVFEAKTMACIHFTKSKIVNLPPLILDGANIVPQDAVKLLGVRTDEKLFYGDNTIVKSP